MAIARNQALKEDNCKTKPDSTNVIPKHLVISSWNINCGLIRKQIQIEQYINEHKIDILAIQEVDLKHYSDKHPFVIPGYTTYSNIVKSSEDKTRLLLIVKEGLKFSIRNDLMDDKFCSVWIEIQAKRKLLLSAFYREWDDGSHDKSVTHQRDNLKVFLDQIRQASRVKGNTIAIMGDMNIDLNKGVCEDYPLKTLYHDLEGCLAENGLVNVDLGNTFTAFRTRVDGTRISSAIDHLYISDYNCLREWEVLNIGVSDHSPIKAVLQLKDFRERSGHIMKRSFKYFDKNAFNCDLASQSWEDLGRTEDVDVMARLFTNYFLRVLNKHAPYKQVKRNKKWKKITLSRECQELIRRRDMVAKKIKNSATIKLEDGNEFRRLRNKVTSLTRKEKKQKIASEIDRDPSGKNIWRIVNNQISNSNKSCNIKIVENGEEVRSNEGTAEIFNQYFHDKILGLRERINDDFKKDPLQKMEQKMEGKNGISFHLRTVREEQVLKILSNLKAKRSTGFDDISANMLKKSAEIICLPLTRIINTSITSGIFPESWKLAIVKPLFKKGKKSDKVNYRPISLLSAPSMVLERVVRFQIVNYMERNNLFGSNQFGFRSNKSTVGAILSMYSTCIKNQDQGECSAIALYDLSAAFDCMDAEILCSKLCKLGFDAQSVAWIKSYLTGRKQKVMVGDSSSKAINLPFGSPQGSCLSPCLFIILLSDIELWVENSELIGYCDDTSGITQGKTEEEAVQLLEKDAIKILEFMASNKLVINPSKTCIMINTKSNQSKVNSVLIGDKSVPVEKSGKLLGVEVSSDFKWNCHLNELAKVMNQRISLIKRLKENMMPAQLIQVGEALVNSKIRYGIAAYCPVRFSDDNSKNVMIQRIQVLQNCLMRTILGKRQSDCVPVKTLLKQTGYLSVNQLGVYHTLQEVFSILNYQSIPSLAGEFLKSKNEFYNTRQSEKDLFVLHQDIVTRRISFILRGVKLWNELPTNIKSITKKDNFSNHVREWVISNIPI